MTLTSIDIDRLWQNVQAGRDLRYYRGSGFTFTRLVLSINSAMTVPNFVVGFVLPNSGHFYHTSRMMEDIFKAMEAYDCLTHRQRDFVRLDNRSEIFLISAEETGCRLRGRLIDRLEFDVDLPLKNKDLYYELMARLRLDNKSDL